ncbi:peroxisomal ATPase PEX6 isoform X1 [Bemisia tabaci]|uniref:peroxisomal ATPase PEX6 isoform X1 n=3 Tax=Bemisia tabaci TaxID=7038 RepID=UPI003B27EC87
MSKVNPLSLQQKQNFLALLQFLVNDLHTPSSSVSAQIFADAFAVFLIYHTISFNLKSVSNLIFESSFLHSIEILEDCNRFVIMHEDLCRLLHIKNFDWIIFSFKSNSNVARAACLRRSFQVISLSHGKHLEISVTDDTLCSILNQLNTTVDLLKITFFRKWTGLTPKIATKATVQLLETFHLPSVNIIDDIFHSYFSCPRFLNQYDIFSINVLKYFPEKFFAAKHFTPSSMQCKVVNIHAENESDNSGFLVSNNDTSLSQLHNYHGFLTDASCHKSHHKQDFKLVATPPLPKGFKKYFCRILSWCNLFMRNNQNDLCLLPFFLVSGANGSGRSTILKSVAKFLGLQYFKTDCLFLQTPTPGYADAQLKNLFSKFSTCAPCLVHFANFEALCVNSNGMKDDRLASNFINQFNDLKSEWPIVIFATAQNSARISGTIARLFLESLEMEALDQFERMSVLFWTAELQQIAINPGCLQNLAERTTGFLFTDLINLLDQTILNWHKTNSLMKPQTGSLEWENFEAVFKKIQLTHASSIGAPKIPAVSWDDIGGLGCLKQDILKMLSTLPISNNLRRSGLLLHGPPGTGKTLIAKAIATECNSNFLSVKGPELLNMYVGQSEQNVREIFSKARSASPCVVFFDELDSLAPNRGKNGDSGGVVDRVVSQFLAEMDEVQKSDGIFVLAATNRPDLIDPALLRPGRLDKLIYVGPCKDEESKLHVLKSLTRKYNLDEDVDLAVIVKDLTKRVTGADISAICSAAWLNAVRRLITNHESDGGTIFSETVVVKKEDFHTSIKAL